MNEKNALTPLIQFGTLSVKRLPNKVELIDHSGDRIALVLFSNYDYSNDGALALERANAIADACNSHDSLVAAAEHAREVLSTLYAKYGNAIGPYSSQAQQCNVELGAALKAAKGET